MSYFSDQPHWADDEPDEPDDPSEADYLDEQRQSLSAAERNPSMLLR